jgi:hypothetical protein
MSGQSFNIDLTEHDASHPYGGPIKIFEREGSWYRKTTLDLFDLARCSPADRTRPDVIVPLKKSFANGFPRLDTGLAAMAPPFALFVFEED